MPLGITLHRKKQRKITLTAFGSALALLAVLFALVNTPEGRRIYEERILTYLPSLIPPPPAPDLPATPQPEVRRLGPVNLEHFKPDDLAKGPKVDPFLDPRALKYGVVDEEGVSLATEAMIPEVDLLRIVVDDAAVPVKSFIERLFPAGPDVASKARVIGAPKRQMGNVVLAVLDIPGDRPDYPWSGGELEAVADFVAKNSGVSVRLGARAVSFGGPYMSFDTWLDHARNRAPGGAGELSEAEPEVDGLELIADAVPYLAERDYERYRKRVRNVLADYLRVRFEVRILPEQGQWVSRAARYRPLLPYEIASLEEAEQAFLSLHRARTPTGDELRPIYAMLRTIEAMQLPILFCEPRGVPATVSRENMRLLRTYVRNGGFVYFVNTGDASTALAIRGLIGDLIEEKLGDELGDRALARLRQNDRDVSGYDFRDPEPATFHPRTFFPFVLPRRADVTLTVYNSWGTPVYRRVVRDVEPGAYVHRTRGLRWEACDDQGAPLQSGYYIYQIESGLCRKTGAMRISALRKLPSGRHGIFASLFNLSDVPTVDAVEPRRLPYGEQGTFGVHIKDRLVICYTEGYGEKQALTGTDASARETTLKWMANVVMHALGEGSLARR